MTNFKLDARLSAAASLCGSGTVADIGTDHAYLPIHLVNAGTPRALASDINEGPCDSARKNVAAHGLADKITVACRPGLDGIEAFAPDNIFICGMGGELIADILAASDYPRAARCRLILQPMTMHAALRRYLAGAGFAITDERVVREGSKHYQLIAAVYDGTVRSFSAAEYALGEKNLARAAKHPTEADISWLTFVRTRASARVCGRASAGLDNDEQRADRALLAVIEPILQGVSSHA
ncbi:MAG: SAM-dependent methyltransferase [Clostridia bacterium]|nr:SAM-dependent methyltransferase [Clostridia bacterium]